MEIIKQGKLPKYKIECPNCHTKFKFDYNEIGTLINEIGTIKLRKNYIGCPLCKIRITFNNNDEIKRFQINGAKK